MGSDGPHAWRFQKRKPRTRHSFDESGTVKGVYTQTDNTLEVIAMALDVQCPDCRHLAGSACVAPDRSALVIHAARIKAGRRFHRFDPPK
jgi:hypothetical protein